MTTKSNKYPTRVELKFQKKNGWVVLDQIRTVDKKRIIKRLGEVDKKTIFKVKNVLSEMLVE